LLSRFQSRLEKPLSWDASLSPKIWKKAAAAAAAVAAVIKFG